MPPTPVLSNDEWLWLTDLAARQAEDAGFYQTAAAFRLLSGFADESARNVLGANIGGDPKEERCLDD